MLVADDYLLEAGGPEYRSSSSDLTSSVCHKEELSGSRDGPVTSLRPVTSMSVFFEEGLGRVMYVAGALECERPFLTPLYKFMSLHPRGSVRKVPAYVSFFLAHLSKQTEENRHYSCAAEQRSSAVSPRVDAQASEGRTGPGSGPERDTRPVDVTMIQHRSY